MNIIVTGGAGFIGSNFIFYMLDRHPDYRIVCLDCLTYAGNISTLAPIMDRPNFRFVKDSITDREAVYRLFEEEQPDMVVNFAAESHVDRSIDNPQISWRLTLLVLLYSWTTAGSMVFRDIIRYQQTKFTVIFRLTDQIISLRKRRQSIRAALTVLRRLRQPCCFLHTIGHMGFR